MSTPNCKNLYKIFFNASIRGSERATYELLFLRKKFLTVDGILGHLEEDQVPLHHAVDVVLMPPEDDDVTDEDSEDEEEILPKDPNHLGRGILSQEAEMVILEDDADDEPDAQPDDQPDNQPASQVKCEILPIPFIFFE